MSTATMDPDRVKFVVEHQGVGPWRRGDVISLRELEEQQSDVDRLLGLRALRAATHLEAGQRHVDLPSEQAQLSFQHLLAEKDQEILRLKGRISELEEEKANKAQVVVAEAQRGAADIVREKDTVINTLQARIKHFEMLAQQELNAPATPDGGRRGEGGGVGGATTARPGKGRGTPPEPS